jgi:hypothetical protein
MRIIRSNFIVFGLLSGASIALSVTLVVSVWEWLENPGGIFRGPDGTNWGFVYDTAISWLLPTFVYAAIIASLVHLLITALASGHRKFRGDDGGKGGDA